MDYGRPFSSQSSGWKREIMNYLLLVNLLVNRGGGKVEKFVRHSKWIYIRCKRYIAENTVLLL